MRLIGRRRHLEPAEVGPPLSLRELVDQAKELLAHEGGRSPALYVSTADRSATFTLEDDGAESLARTVDALTRGADRFVLAELRHEEDGGETALIRAQEGRKRVEWTASLVRRAGGTVRRPEWVRLR